MTKLEYRVMQLENDLKESQHDIIELCHLHKVMLDMLEHLIRNPPPPRQQIIQIAPVQTLFKRNNN